ncbi:MAG: UDP-N-acetylmuramoyl-tripeptide--D-alanyl-D-alanine ligase [Candidatus Omnitrophica bacterium]|nr:UDP-N-acetylmuramoyl-tripeptide--D-alanyl-D-alanine ligase [Candidatus Omnitrophota bacterium]
MPAAFTVEEIIRATGARLVSGGFNRLIKGVSIDSRKLKAGEAFIAIKGERFDGHSFIGGVLEKHPAAVIVEKEGAAVCIPKDICLLRVPDTRRALGDIAAFHRNRFNIPVIAVTGSAGKTTAKEMAAHILSARFKVLKNEGTENNHIGVPLTLLRLNKSHQAAVIELGTNHFGEIEELSRISSPNVGIIINIGPAHLEYLGDLSGVLKEKASLIKNLRHPAVAVLNSDDPMLRKIAPARGARVFSFGANAAADMAASEISLKADKLRFRVNSRCGIKLGTLGRHNVYNALAAITAARILGMGYAAIKQRLASFKFPSGRLNLLKRGDFFLIDDSYNSNPLSLEKALSALSGFTAAGRKILVMGDMLELGEDREHIHRSLCEKIKGACDVFISVGDLSGLVAEELKKDDFNCESIFICGSSKDARDILFESVRPKADDVVLIKGSRRMRLEDILT